ncbi:MAG: hypothetical protein ACYC6F_03355 [Longimicrobiales bacterium]
MNGTIRLRGLFAFVTAGSMMVFTGCDAGTGPGDPELASEDADAIASFMFDVDALSVAMANLASATGTRSFTRTAPCPAGGSINVSGSGESSTNQETRVVSTKWTNNHTHAACAITKTRGDRTWTAVVDGSATASGTSSYQLPETRGGQRTLLSWASATVGSTTTKVGDRTSTCAVDIKQTWDPVKQVFTIKGTMCGRQVDTTRTLGR